MTGEFAGELRERILLETRLGNRDAIAGSSGRYAHVGEAWAAISPLMPADLSSADSVSALPRWRVIMRKREGVDPRMRLLWRGRYLAVQAVVSDPREPAQMILTCAELR